MMDDELKALHQRMTRGSYAERESAVLSLRKLPAPDMVALARAEMDSLKRSEKRFRTISGTVLLLAYGLVVLFRWNQNLGPIHLLFWAMIGLLSLGVYAIRQRFSRLGIADALANSTDAAEVPAILTLLEGVEALRTSFTVSSPKTEEHLRTALKGLLPKVTAEQTVNWTDQQRKALLLPFAEPTFDKELTIKTLRVVGFAGTKDALPYVEAGEEEPVRRRHLDATGGGGSAARSGSSPRGTQGSRNPASTGGAFRRKHPLARAGKCCYAGGRSVAAASRAQGVTRVATQTIREMTIPVPEKLAKRIDREAKQLNKRPAEVAAQRLSDSFGPDMAEIDAQIDKSFREAAKLPLEELQRRAVARISPNEQEKLDELLDLNGEGQLTEDGQVELDRLIDRVMEVADQAVAARWALNNVRRVRRRER
jgi:hypothetical protein